MLKVTLTKPGGNTNIGLIQCVKIKFDGSINKSEVFVVIFCH